MTKISIIIPVYNGSNYLVRALDSALAQTYKNIEIIVVNDGSTDDTEQIIRSFTDERIRLINQSNQGVAAALNMGLLNARAELVSRFDADDICLHIHDLGVTNLAQLADYGITQATLDALATTITNFTAKIGSPRQHVINTKTTPARIICLLRPHI